MLNQQILLNILTNLTHYAQPKFLDNIATWLTKTYNRQKNALVGEFSNKEKTLSAAADDGWTNQTSLHASVHEGNSARWLNHHLVTQLLHAESIRQ